MTTVTISFSLDNEKDQDLVCWIDSLPKRGRSEAIREALRSYLEHDVSLSDVYQAVKELERRIGQAPVSGNHKEASEEPDDIAAALDNLGL